MGGQRHGLVAGVRARPRGLSRSPAANSDPWNFTCYFGCDNWHSVEFAAPIRLGDFLDSLHKSRRPSPSCHLHDLALDDPLSPVNDTSSLGHTPFLVTTSLPADMVLRSGSLRVVGTVQRARRRPSDGRKPSSLTNTYYIDGLDRQAGLLPAAGDNGSAVS